MLKIFKKTFFLFILIFISLIFFLKGNKYQIKSNQIKSGSRFEILLSQDTSLSLSVNHKCNEMVKINDDRPDVLIIGDSISIGYTKYLRKMNPNIDFVHSPCNAMSSDYTRDNIHDWIELRPNWSAILFNNGLWDIADWVVVPPERYKNNLRAISNVIKLHTLNPFFVLSTYVPPFNRNRRNSDVLLYNELAKTVMLAKDIQVIDLYEVSQRNYKLTEDYYYGADVHWSNDGYTLFAKKIDETLKRQVSELVFQ